VLIGRTGIVAVLVGVLLLVLAGASAAAGANLVYWSNQGAPPGPGVSFANLDGSGGSDLSTTGATTDEPAGVTIDAATGKVYWANMNGTISYANLAGGGGSQLNITGATADNPFGVAIDPGQGRIYWANLDSDTDPIAYANLDGSGGGNLNVTGATADGADGLAVDPATGKVYWANYSNATISYANLDGSGGGGQLDTTGVTPQGPNGVAIDAATGKLYWSNFGSNSDPISFANLDGSGGGGNLSTTGATASGAFGLALDPSAGKVYWANVENNTMSYADLSGGGAGQLNLAGSTSDAVGWPALLETPVATGSPTISGGSTPGSVLSCSQGSWAPDVVESFLYRAPQSYSYTWTHDGAPMSGATTSSVAANASGPYACQLSAANYAGSITQASSTHTIQALACTLKPGDKPVTPAGRLTLTARCNQPAALKLSGKIAVNESKHKTKSFTVNLASHITAADRSRTLTVSLPRKALSALRAGHHESIAFTLTATNIGGTTTTPARIKALKLSKAHK
jgi:DNA-binding beta-propeller fold protein YncE